MATSYTNSENTGVQGKVNAETTCFGMSYSIVRTLPTGRETQVCLVEDRGELKVWKRPQSVCGARQIERERNHMMRLVGSPGVIQLKDSFLEQHRTLVYDYYKNGDLLDYLLTAKEPDIKGIMRSLLETISRLHDLGIAHRDIKPENILLTDEGLPVLADFGMATTELSSKSRMGTLWYHAPEITSRLEYSPMKADVWSFGVTVLVAHYSMTPFPRGAMVPIDFPAMWQWLDGHADKVVDTETKEFLEYVLQPEEFRPTARHLLTHPWLN